MEIRDPAEAKQPFANVLLYGPPKTGKTAAAATAPGLVFLINCDLPNATLFAHRRDAEGRLREVLIPEWSKGKTPVMDLLTEFAHAVMQSPRVADTVVVDPIGELYRMLLEEASSRALRPSMNIRYEVTTQLERWCRHMCKAPVNFVMVAHQLMVDQENEDETVVVHKPFTGSKNGSLTGLGPKLTGMVDIVGYTAVMPPAEGEENARYVAQLVPVKGREGGDRFDVLGPYADLNLTDWFEKAGVWTGETQPSMKEAA